MRRKFLTSSLVAVSAILLSCVGAISVGFASWIISQGDETTTTGNINADVIDTNIRGVTILGESLTIGHYYFDDGNGGYSDTADLTYLISYDHEKITLSGTNTISLSCSLSFGSGLAIFKSDYFNAVTYSGNPVSYVYHASNTAIEFIISETIGNQNVNNKALVFTINNKMIAKHGSQMNGDSFYLRMEVVG